MTGASPGSGPAPDGGPQGDAEVPFVKAHGAGNDFIVVDDHDGGLESVLTVAAVRALCRRRLGLGADGLLRVVRVAAAPPDAAAVVRDAGERAAAGGPPVPEWFMDYRNADGSAAQMCGNGVRVFAAHLRAHRLVPAGGPVRLLTRAGVRTVRDARSGLPAGWTTVSMGPVALDAPGLTVLLGDRRWPALAVDVGNPHAVVVVSEADLAALPGVGLLPTPTVDPAATFADGFNLELVAVTGPAAVRVRIVERGVGETLACGTGVCAAVAVTAAAGLLDRRAVEHGVAVAVPGGALDVRLVGSAPAFTDAELSGPAEVVATGTVWLRRR